MDDTVPETPDNDHATSRRPPEVSSGVYWAPVPESLIYDADMSDKAVRVYAALMRHGLDPSSCYPSHARLADLIGCAARSVQRPLRDLEQAGWIERVRRLDESGQRISDGFHVHTLNAQERAPTALLSAEGTRADARTVRAETRAEREQVNESNGTKAPDETRQRATQIVDKVWERSDPKPATPYIGCVKIAEKLLKAGHDPQDIGRAMLEAPTISTGAVEFAINRRTKPAPSRREPIDTNREGPEGRIDL